MLPNFVLDVRGLVAKPPDKRLVTENQRSLAFVSQFVLVSGLVRNRFSGISVPRAFPIYTGWCPLASLVPPLDRNREPDAGTAWFVEVLVCRNSSMSNQMLAQLDLLRYWFAETARCETRCSHSLTC